MMNCTGSEEFHFIIFTVQNAFLTNHKSNPSENLAFDLEKVNRSTTIHHDKHSRKQMDNYQYQPHNWILLTTRLGYS